MAAIPIEYTAYGHLREGDWIAHRSSVGEDLDNEPFYNLRALTFRRPCARTGAEETHYAGGTRLCTRILPVGEDAF